MASDHLIPERLNREFFIKVLQKAFHFGNTVSIDSLDVQLASEAGDNYCSEIYRANLVFKVRNGGQQPNLQQISLVVKDMPPGEHRGEILTDLQVYEREVEMYWTTIPAMSKLVTNEFFSAKCLYATTEPCKVMVFQDLKALGYQMADRKAGLDYDHCQLIVQKLGKFHAASMMLAAAQPDSVSKYSYGIFNPNTRKKGDHVENYYNSSMEALIAIVERWSGYEKIVEKLRKMQDSFVDKIYKHVETTGDTICVLNHGDLWVNNVMFKYENQTLDDVVFVDYQMCFYTTPGIDLNYFLNTSPTQEVRMTRRQDLIADYYEALHENLTALSHPIVPTFEQIKAEVHRKEFYGFIASFAVLPIVLMEKQSDKGSGLDAFLNEESGNSMRDICYGGKQYQKAMRYNLKRFDEIGVLD